MNLLAVLLFICFSTAYGLQCQIGGTKVNTDSTIETREPNKTKECGHRHGIPLCGREEFINSDTGSSGTYYFCYNDNFAGRCYRLKDDCNLKSGKIGEKFHGKWNLCCSSSGNFTNLTSIFSSAGSLSPTSSALLQSSSSASEKSDNTGLFIGIGVGVGVLLILLIVAAILIYCFCCKKKKPSGGKATTGDGGKMKNGKTPKPAVESHYV